MTAETIEERAEELREQEERIAVENILSTPDGRVLAWAILREAGFFQSSFAGEQPLTMAMNEGRRIVGAFMFHNLFTAGPNTFSMMGLEASEREARYLETAKKEFSEE